MYNYAELPLIIFILVLIPPIIIGLVRGWIASLVISLSVFSFVIIAAFTSTFYYDSFLWPTFKGMFMEGKVNAHLDIDSFASVSKQSIIAVWVAILILPIYGMTIGLYFAMKKLLVKHLWPKTAKINTYSKTIYRQKHIPSRTLGALISIGSGTLVAGTAAAGAGVLMSPVDEFTTFNSFISGTSSIYTINQGKYDSSFQRVRDFSVFNLPNSKLGNDRVEALKQLFLIKEDGMIDNAQMQYIQSHPRFVDRINSLGSDSEAIKFMSSIIIASIHLPSKVQLIRPDHSNPTGGGDVVMAGQLRNLQTQIAAYNFGLKLSESTVNGLVDNIVNEGVASFEETKYYQDWQQTIKELNNIRHRKITLQAELSGLTNKVKSDGVKRDSLKATINNLNKEIQTYEATNSGLIAKADAVYQAKSLDFTQKNKAYTDNKNAYDAAEAHWRGLVKDADNLRIQISTKDSEISLETRNINALKAEITILNAEITSLTSQMPGASDPTVGAELQKKLDEATKKRDEKEAAKQAADARLATLSADHKNLADQLSLKTTEANDYHSGQYKIAYDAYSKSKTAKETAYREMMSAKNALDQLNKKLNDLKSRLNKYTNDYNNIIHSIDIDSKRIWVIDNKLQPASYQTGHYIPGDINSGAPIRGSLADINNEMTRLTQQEKAQNQKQLDMKPKYTESLEEYKKAIKMLLTR